MLLPVQVSGVLLYGCAKIEATSCGMYGGAWVLPLPHHTCPVLQCSGWGSILLVQEVKLTQDSALCFLCTEFFLLSIQQQLLLTTSLEKDAFHCYLLLSLAFQKSRTMDTDAESCSPRNYTGRQQQGGRSIFPFMLHITREETVFILSFLQGASPSY